MLDDKAGIAAAPEGGLQDGGDDRATQDVARKLGRAASLAALAGATAACGGGDGGSGGGGPIGGGGGGGGGGGTPPPTVLKPETDQQAARFLLRASLYASQGEIDRLKSQGYEPWLDGRIAAANDQSGGEWMAAKRFERVDSNRWYNSRNPGDRMIWAQLLRGGNSVRKRAALSLSEIFVVSLNNLDMTWRSSAITAYWDILNEHAFGNYRDLLEAITLNPAMGVFLNTRGNRKEDPATGRVPDENYGREVMQLFSIGLYELNRDGTPKTDGSGNFIETYDNDDVTGIAKAFTGYDFDFTGIGFTQEVGGTRQIEDAAYAYKPMTADTSKWRQTWLAGRDFHSDEEKRFLDTVIPAGTGAADTLRITLDTLFNHPNVGPFIGRQLIQRLVTSNPSGAYVGRVADAFDNNGSGVRGDLGAVFKAVLTDEEALAEGNLGSATFGKLREPMLRYAQWGRTFDARSDNGTYEIGDLSAPDSRLGQAPLRSPSVFNFFRPGYVPLNSETASRNLVAPEMQLVNETSVAGYVNFMERVIENRGYWARDVKARYTGQLPIAHDASALLDQLDLLLTANQLADDTKSAILTALQSFSVTESSPDDAKLARIYAGAFLVMISNDYQVQR